MPRPRLWATVAVTAMSLLLGLLGAPAGAAATTPRPAPGEVVGATYGGLGTPWPGTYYQGLDRRLVRAWSGGTEDLGGILTSGPVTQDVGAPGAQWQYVFVRGADGAVWSRSGDAFAEPPAWGSWRTWGGQTLGAPSASCIYIGEESEDSQGIVWVRGTDGALWARLFDQGEFNPASRWVRLGGRLLSDPSASGCSLGPQRVYALGTDHAVWEFSNRYGVEPGTWRRIGGTSSVAPAAANNRLFARGTDNALWMKTRDLDTGTWSRWRSLGGYLTSPPSAGGGAGVLALGAGGRNIWQASSRDDGATWTWAPHVPGG